MWITTIFEPCYADSDYNCSVSTTILVFQASSMGQQAIQPQGDDIIELWLY